MFAELGALFGREMIQCCLLPGCACRGLSMHVQHQSEQINDAKHKTRPSECAIFTDGKPVHWCVPH